MATKKAPTLASAGAPSTTTTATAAMKTTKTTKAKTKQTKKTTKAKAKAESPTPSSPPPTKQATPAPRKRGAAQALTTLDVPAVVASPNAAPVRRRGSDRVVAVVGAFGFLGRRLLARLEADPGVDRIIAIDVRSGLSLLEDSGDDDERALLTRHPKVSAHNLDLTTPGADRELAEILRVEDAGSLFHLALLSTPTHHHEMAHELETIGTHYVLHAAAEAGIGRLVSVSSTMCYGARPDNPAFLTEEHPLRPPPSRALRDKADADEQARRFAAEHPHIAVAVARLGAMLPTAKDHFWTRIFSRRFVPAVLGYDPLLQLLHPDDAIEALLALWQAAARGPFNVVGKGQLPLSHILTRLERAPLYLPAGIGQSLIGALWQAQLVDMPQHYFGFLRWPWLADDRRLRGATDFHPRHDLPTLLTIAAAAKAPKDHA